jgi:hypothetical protein
MNNGELLAQNIKLSLLLGIAYGALVNITFDEDISHTQERLRRLLDKLENGIDEIYYLQPHPDNSDTT